MTARWNDRRRGGLLWPLLASNLKTRSGSMAGVLSRSSGIAFMLLGLVTGASAKPSCAVVGDSIAVGAGQHMEACRVNAKIGIQSKAVIARVNSSADVNVVSAGSNDPANPQSSRQSREHPLAGSSGDLDPADRRPGARRGAAQWRPHTAIRWFHSPRPAITCIRVPMSRWRGPSQPLWMHGRPGFHPRRRTPRFDLAFRCPRRYNLRDRGPLEARKLG